MAGYLPKLPEAFYPIPQARVAIICAQWHSNCVDAMALRAQRELLVAAVEPQNIQIHRIPGSLELPFAARCLFEADDQLDAIIAFGVILQGATGHADAVTRTVVEGFARVMDRFHKPIINEVIAVASLADAEARADNSLNNKGVEAVFALTELLHWRHQLG